LKWDGVDRVSTVVSNLVIQSGDPKLHRVKVTKWLTSAIASVFEEHGAVTQGVLVLKGAQGVGKSHWFASLLPKELEDYFHSDSHLDLRNKDAVITATSAWICELAELDGSFRRSDIAAIKGFLTNRVDRYRAPYDRMPKEVVRRVVFGASVNPDKFLQDDTGNRRYWTVILERIARAPVDVGQLWAQVKEQLYRPGDPMSWTLTEEEQAAVNEENLEFKEESNESAAIDDVVSCFDWGSPERVKMTRRDLMSAINMQYNGQNSRIVGKALQSKEVKEVRSNGGRFFMVPPLVVRNDEALLQVFNTSDASHVH
jgi:putative DNA primase/helicase